MGINGPFENLKRKSGKVDEAMRQDIIAAPLIIQPGDFDQGDTLEDSGETNGDIKITKALQTENVVSKSSAKMLKMLEDELLLKNPTLSIEAIKSNAVITGRRLSEIRRKKIIARTGGKEVKTANKFKDDTERKPRRQELPAKPKGGSSLWSVIRNSVGKDLSSITIPVGFSEPLSMLQRLAEDFQYSSLLDQASKITDPLEQLAFVTAFTITAYSTSGNRLNKPFNPLYRETFELDRSDDMGWKLMSEQVMQTPPTSAQYCESKNWRCWKTFSGATMFRGRYIKVSTTGTAHLVLSGGQLYSWGRVGSVVNNVMMGKMWLDNVGQMEVVSHTYGCKCVLTYVPFDSYIKVNQRRVIGIITDFEDNIRWRIDGKWDKYIHMTPVKVQDDIVVATGPATKIWEVTETPAEISVFYNFSLFSCQLNEPEDFVAPTDSRKRQDIRLMEEGKWDEADTMKRKMEQQDREMKKSIDATQPVWFTAHMDPVSQEKIYLFNDTYWKAKEIRDWTNCPSIYKT